MKFLKLIFIQTLFASQIANAAALPFRVPGLISNAPSEIGTDASPLASAVFDINSTTRGLLIPRMTTTQKNAISSPATGLLVYDTTLSALFQYNGSGWKQLASDGLTFTGPVVGNVTGTVTGHSSLDLTIANNLSDVSTPATAFNNISGFTLLGDTHYGGASGVRSVLAGNTTSTKKYLAQTGTGTVSAAPAWSQPACADLSNSAASCSTDTTNASNISSGTLPAGRLPNPSATTLGGVESLAAVSNNFLTSISTSGVPTQARPTCADLSDSVASCSTDTTNATNVTTGTLGATVQGNITTVGTIGTGTWAGTAVAVNHGGTGQTTYTDGQLLIGNSSGNTLTKATLTAGSNVTITNGNGSISIAASGSTPSFAVSAKTATYNVTTSDNVLYFSGATPGNIVLPTAVGNTNYYKFCKTDASYANVWPITTTSSQTISGFASGAIQLASFMDCYELFSDNSNWQISSHTYGEGVIDGGAITVGAVTTPPTLNGTITLNKYSYSRHGHFIHVQYRFNQTTASTGGSGTYKFPLPTGITADVTATGIAAYTGATNASGAGTSYVGSGMVYASTTAINGEIYAELYDTTNLAFQIFSVSGTNFGMFGSAVVGFNNAILSFTVDADVPVSSFTP